MPSFGTCAIFGGLGGMGKAAVVFMKHLFEKFVILDMRKPTEDDIAFFAEAIPESIPSVRRMENMSESMAMYRPNVCIGALPSKEQFTGAQTAFIAGNCHYFDLGADQEVLVEQKMMLTAHQEMKKKKQTYKDTGIEYARPPDAEEEEEKKIFMPFCGFDPGMLNILVRSAAKHLDCDSIDVLVGGFPAETPVNHLHHEWAFNPKSTLETYRGETRAIEKGALVRKKALSGISYVNVGNETMEAFYTNCGNIPLMETIATDKLVMRRLKECTIRTVRRAGHWDAISPMVAGGIFDDDVFERNAEKLAKNFPIAQNDMTFFRLTATKGGRQVCRIEWTEKADETFSAMQKATMKSTALIIERVLGQLYADVPQKISGFIMPETFFCEMLDMVPEEIVKLMRISGLNVQIAF